MIITLKSADFSKNNINDLLNTFSVSYSGTGVTGTPRSIAKENGVATESLSATITIASNYTYESLTVRVGGNTLTAGTDYTVSGTGPVTLSIPAAKITGNVVVSVQTSSAGGDVVDPDEPTNHTFTINATPSTAYITLGAAGYSSVAGTGSASITVASGTEVTYAVSAEGYTPQEGGVVVTGTTSENIVLVASGSNVVFDFDFTTSTLADYADDGIFTVPDTSTIEAITYDSTKGANLNNNLPYGLTLTNPIDAARPWTLEFTATMVTPTVLVGNRRAFITGGSDLAPFVVINFSGSNVDSQGFQISNGSHKWVGTGELTCDQEVSYKIVHDGASNVVVYQNGTEFGTTTCDFTGKTFGTILGVIKGKSSAYIWQDVESGKKSYLKKFKFSYN